MKFYIEEGVIKRRYTNDKGTKKAHIVEMGSECFCTVPNELDELLQPGAKGFFQGELRKGEGGYYCGPLQQFKPLSGKASA